MEQTQISFPNGAEYFLCPEKNLTQKCGIYFPSTIEDKTLFVTGISGSGKTTLVKSLCKEKRVSYHEQLCLLLGDKPYFREWSFAKKGLIEPSMNEILDRKIIDGHFVFQIPFLGRDILFPHFHEIYSADYGNLQINNICKFDNIFKNKFSFEFRQTNPLLIQVARRDRFQNEIANNSSMIHPDLSNSVEEIAKGQYLLYQVAHFLFEKEIDVYIRTDFNGVPLRFAK